MRKLRLVFVSVIIITLAAINPPTAFSLKSAEHAVASNALSKAKEIYAQAILGDYNLSYKAFEQAYKGYLHLLSQGKIKNAQYLIITDFTSSSNTERFYVIDLENRKVIFNELVAHGRNSGEEFAQSFSNEVNSYKSSPGFYITAETYNGKHGLSLRLDGMEKGINDKARERAVVIHAADYVSYDFINKHGRLGRSFGCPALPKDNYDKIVDVIKEGACLYIHTNDKKYQSTSLLLNS
ncbi:MAG: murein L,D-transpeptidase catalytic domain family protein [Bacteroidia bacterium]